ncbi:MAG TPA: hypothetical protein VMF91_23620 [Bryobacteraceae bacterium]|nr:hypothetical protein [Bryobacteraceae bacterium]
MILVSVTGCIHKPAVPIAVAGASTENSYMDLAAGGRLRIVVPIATGYEISHYLIEPRHAGQVRLRFVSAAITRNGVTAEDTGAPALPFALPRTGQHIRLIYLVRKSSADHKMAIAASKNLPALNAFTGRFQADPNICDRDPALFCSWVPAGVAIRPE